MHGVLRANFVTVRLRAFLTSKNLSARSKYNMETGNKRKILKTLCASLAAFVIVTAIGVLVAKQPRFGKFQLYTEISSKRSSDDGSGLWQYGCRLASCCAIELKRNIKFTAPKY